MTLDEYSSIVKYLKREYTLSEIKGRIGYFQKHLQGIFGNNLSVECHLCFILAIMKVPKEEILNMTFEEGLTYIHLFGD